MSPVNKTLLQTQKIQFNKTQINYFLATIKNLFFPTQTT